jgi:hypothetical protein
MQCCPLVLGLVLGQKKKHATFSPFLDVTMGRHVPNVTMKGFGACFQCHDAACAGSGAGLLARNRMDQKVWGLPVLDFLFKCLGTNPDRYGGGSESW